MRVISIIVLFLAAIAASADEIPVESFAHLPMIEDPTVSFDGKYVAAVLNTEAIPSVVVAEFGKSDLTAVLRLKKESDRIEWVRWANNDRLLVSASFSTYWGGERLRLNRLYAVDRDGENLLPLVHKKAGFERYFSWFKNTDRVLTFLPNDPRHILLEQRTETERGPSVFKVDIYKSTFEKLVINTYDLDSWFADRAGNVVLGVGWDRDKGEDRDVFRTWYRKPGTKKWQELSSYRVFKENLFSVVDIDGDKAIVLSDRELGRDALWQYDIPTGEFENLLFAADGLDVGGPILSTDRSTVIGARYTEHYPENHYFSESDAALDELVQKTFPQFHTYIASRSLDENRLMVGAYRHDAPLQYFWLDLAAKRGGPWFNQFPHLKDKKLAEVKPIEFSARDGLRLTGYLTLPVNAAEQAPPLIVMPHGGPRSRDRFRFDPILQLLASRGYAVLQVNFRGSSGFGSEFEEAGYKEWGMAMQQDVYDAIAWLEKQGSVNTDKACMVGFSYGGFVALTAAYQMPNRFSCIVSGSGVSDLVELLEASRLYRTARVFDRTTIGDPRDDEQKEKLREYSPIRNVARMNAPILMIHGDHDTQVRAKQSQDFLAAAKLAGVDVEYIEQEDGTHYFDDNANRLEMFQSLDRFLKTHLKP